jgi:hypothetical protein
MSTINRQLVMHTFKGKRFEDHGLDLDVLPELYAYKELLVSAAKELWRRHHPDRQRLPKHFEDSLCLKFYQLTEGSVAVPIFREMEVASQTEMFEFQQPDELDEAVLLVTEGVEAANSGRPLPDALPKNIIPLFENYGKTLREDESIELQPQNNPLKASYTTKSRERLLKFCAEGYADTIDFVGEVRAVDLSGKFELRLPDGAKIPARFSPEQEGVITEALCDHNSRRLRVKGKADFYPDSRVKAITTISELTIQSGTELPFDPNARPVWEIIEEIGASVPPEDWAKVPPDAARNLDHYLYGAERK